MDAISSVCEHSISIFPMDFSPPLQVRPLAGQKGLSCGVDTNAGAKDLELTY